MMNHIERVQVALAGGRPDRVPAGEFEIAPALVAALLGKAAERDGDARGSGVQPGTAGSGSGGIADFQSPASDLQLEAAARELLAMDLLAVTPAAPRRDEGGGCFRDAWGRLLQQQRGLTAVRAPAITDLAAAPSYRFPDAAGFDLSPLRRWREETDFFVFAFIDGPFQAVGKLFDFTDFLLAVAGREEAIKELAAAAVACNLELARRCREAGAHGFVIGDDIAYERGTYIHPDLWREVFLPFLRREAEGLQALGLPVLYHSDGNLKAVLPDLAVLPLAGLQCLEPAAGMDIGALKQEYGGRWCLMGNFDLDLLAAGTPEEVAAAARQLLQVAAPGGGYIFSTSGCILGAGLPVANVLALYRTVAEWGVYQEAP